MITRIKGTQDILDTQLHLFLISQLRTHLQKYDFTEIITPILEPTELFKRTVGSQTDIVAKEMYYVHAGDGSQDITLRPEITASMMRAFLQSGIQTTPWSVYTIGPAFRHERPQKGRYREFYQVNIETIGTSSPAYDAYFITMLERFFHERLGIENYALLINYLGCNKDREAYKKKLYAFLTKHEKQLCKTCLVRKEKNILRTLDCKNPQCRELFATAPHITDSLCTECEKEWNLIKQLLEELSVSYTVSPLLVRGLDYYSKIIFEFVDMSVLGAQNTFCAGGRYETIATALSSKKDYPSIGAAMGIERMVLILKTIEDKLPLPVSPPLHVVLPLTQEQVPLSLLLADELQANDLCTTIYLEGASIKSMMRKANTAGAAFCIIIGPDEQAGRYVTVKNMKTGTEEKTPLAELITTLKS